MHGSAVPADLVSAPRARSIRQFESNSDIIRKGYLGSGIRAIVLKYRVNDSGANRLSRVVWV